MNPGRPRQKATCRMDFTPEGKSAKVPAGATLLDAAGKADVYINASCNGKGACGKCKLFMEDGEVEKTETALLSDKEKQKGYVLACQSRIKGPVSVRVPEKTIERKLRVAGMGEEVTRRLQGRVTEISPMLEKISMELSPPSLDDPISDLDRLKRGLKKNGIDAGRTHIGLPVMRQLAAAMRNENWHVTASVMHKACSREVVAAEPRNKSNPKLGLAIDIGNIVISGNTTMTHLLLEIDPRYIRREPYIPPISEFPEFKSGTKGLKANAAVFHAGSAQLRGQRHCIRNFVHRTAPAGRADPVYRRRHQR